MYVRVPFDAESSAEPRDFIMGIVTDINEFDSTAVLEIRDPFNYKRFFEMIPNVHVCRINQLLHCSAYIGACVAYHNSEHVVLSCIIEDEYYFYYLQRTSDRSIVLVREADISIPFNCDHILPVTQLLNYEFQNPCWYIGRTIVSRSMNILENSIGGFTELAGCKIEILPHQLMTIMRCLQGSRCRYMLADEVGMGKTIEALGILKVFLNHRTNQNVLILMPPSLREQWRTEMLFKFDLGEENSGNNRIYLCSDEKVAMVTEKSWNFVIADEAHHYLRNIDKYSALRSISKNSKNILLLSATPVQERGEEYLRLVTLLDPERYESFETDHFEELVDRQKKLTKSVHFIYVDIEDLQELIDDVQKEEDPHDNEEVQDLFEDLKDKLIELSNELGDTSISGKITHIKFESEDVGIGEIQGILAYVTENYQIAANVIRNRRGVLHDIVGRSLIECGYDIEDSRNPYEQDVYKKLILWITEEKRKDRNSMEGYIPLINSFFSSAFAFSAELYRMDKRKPPEELFNSCASWVMYEKRIIDDIMAAIEHEENNTSRIITAINFLNDNVGRDKVVLFTDFSETFEAYSKCLMEYFGEESIAFYRTGMDSDSQEINAYKFQNNEACQFLLADRSGGEGRNFQNAKYVVHLDLPWNVVDIEQRIGRLDRIGRRNDFTTCSIVIYAKDTIEESIFRVFNEGLHVFTQSLSGLEIVMGDLQEIIINSILGDLEFGLQNSMDKVIETTGYMKQGIQGEQIYDVAAYRYKYLSRKIDRIVRLYNRRDTEIFSSAMFGWAGLAGFVAQNFSDGTSGFLRDKFSIRSARNTYLVPPDWSIYNTDERSRYLQRIRELTGDAKKKDRDSGMMIAGTFDRKQAISSDYLHFFAPGDPIFDCIVNNAMSCYKGCSTAFILYCSIEWIGIIFTFKYVPDYQVIYKNGIDLDRCSQYRCYLEGGIVSVPVGFGEYSNTSSKEVVKEYQKYMTPGHIHIGNDMVHLGRRSKSNAILEAKQLGISNIEWFRNIFRENEWEPFVTQAYDSARKMARHIYHKYSRIDLAKEEMSSYIEILKESGKSVDIEQEAKDIDALYQSLKQAKVVLDSAAFIWMKKNGTI